MNFSPQSTWTSGSDCLEAGAAIPAGLRAGSSCGQHVSVLLSVRPSRGCLGLHISASCEQGRPQRCMLIEWTFQEQVRKTRKARRWAAAAEQSVSHMLRAEKDGELHRIWATWCGLAHRSPAAHALHILCSLDAGHAVRVQASPEVTRGMCAQRSPPEIVRQGGSRARTHPR